MEIVRKDGFVDSVKAEGVKVELRKVVDEDYGRDSHMLLIITEGEHVESFTLRGAYSIIDRERKYDPTFGDQRRCGCGHPYERHFDPSENWDPVGCKYCCCGIWHEKPASPEEQEQYDIAVARDAGRKEYHAAQEADQQAKLEALQHSEEYD